MANLDLQLHKIPARDFMQNIASAEINPEQKVTLLLLLLLLLLLTTTTTRMCVPVIQIPHEKSVVVCIGSL